MTEFRPSSFQMIPPVIKNLLIINVLVFLAQQALGTENGQTMTNLFALHDLRSYYFRPHQLITYMFMHGGWDHILFNMLALWMFGSMLENFWGGKRFLIFYMVCGLGAAVCHMAVLYYESGQLLLHMQLGEMSPEETYGRINAATVGASGAIFGCLAAFGYLFPNREMIIIPIPVPIKAKWLVLGYALLELVSGIRGSAGDNVAHWAHLGGGLVGLLLVIWWNRTNRRNFY